MEGQRGLTCPILEVIIDLSMDIEVPPVHVKEKRVNPTFAEMAAGEWARPLIRIQSSSGNPGEAFVSVRHRESYFWIDDRDLGSICPLRRRGGIRQLQKEKFPKGKS